MNKNKVARFLLAHGVYRQYGKQNYRNHVDIIITIVNVIIVIINMLAIQKTSTYPE